MYSEPHRFSANLLQMNYGPSLNIEDVIVGNTTEDS